MLRLGLPTRKRRELEIHTPLEEKQHIASLSSSVRLSAPHSVMRWRCKSMRRLVFVWWSVLCELMIAHKTAAVDTLASG
ncbi:hypothetical protein KCP69_14790 [Salmonella enterica subsp. enterica]|nr:hypothetical protein KCP69_14790 [Salmonella enterica subsp. enterica]